MTDDTDLTQDGFLGGRLKIWQPRDGYRAGVDPVLLAAAVRATAGQSVLELGIGAGVASLCLGARVPGLTLFGVELQSDYAELARRNAAENAIDLTVVTADLRHLPEQITSRGFDHVIANPPYFDRQASTSSANPGRDTALGGDTPLADWLEIAIRRLNPKGWLTLIQRADRLPGILAALDSRVGSITVRPLAARQGRAADLVIVQARKSGRAQFRLLAPLILHDGPRHIRDGDDYTDWASSTLRRAGALPDVD